AFHVTGVQTWALPLFDPGRGRRMQVERPLRPAARSWIRLGRDGLGPDGRAAEKGQQDGHHRPDPDPRPKTRHDWRSLLRAVVSPSRYAYGLGGPVMTGPDKPSYREDGPHIHGPRGGGPSMGFRDRKSTRL